MPIKYFIYARKSSESEDRQMASIDDQVSEMTKQAKELGFEIEDVIFESKSAKEPGRPMFNEMLIRIHKNEASGILCWSLNRLARNPVDGGQISWLLQQNVIKHIKTHSRDYWPADNVLMMQVEFGMANQYVKDLSVDIRRGSRKKAERGWFPSPSLPIGYQHNRTKSFGAQPEIVPTEEFSLIKKLWKLMLSGNYSVAGITREAARLGLRNRFGQPYSKQTFWGMFNHEFYCGYFYWKNEQGLTSRFQGKHKKMVSNNDFLKVQSILQRASIPAPKKGLLKFEYISLIACGECGRSVTAEQVSQGICPICKHKFSIKHKSICPMCKHDLEDGPKYSRVDRTYYRCTKFRTKCSQRTVQPDEIEEQLYAILQKISIDKDFYSWLITCLKEFQDESEQDNRMELIRLKKRATELKKRIKSLVQMRADNEISAEEMVELKNATEEELKGLADEIVICEGKSRKWITAIEEVLNLAVNALVVYENADEGTKKEMIRSLLSNLSLKDKKLYYTTKQPVTAAQECKPIYVALKSTFEPEKSVATYSELGLSDPLRNVMWRLLNDFRTFGKKLAAKKAAQGNQNRLGTWDGYQ